MFYVEKPNSLSGFLPETAALEEGVSDPFAQFYTNWAVERSKRLGLKNDTAKNPQKALVGWYNGQAAQSANLGTDIKHMPYIDVTIINEEELTVRVTVKWDSTIDEAVRAAINSNDATKDIVGSLTVELGPAGSTNTIILSTTGNPRYKVLESLEDDKYIYRCTWVLDSLG